MKSTRGTMRLGCLTAILTVAHLYFANEFPAFPNPNVRSRAYLTLAVVDHGALSIDECVREYGATMDAARVGDRLYSDKAPGASMLLVPIAWVARHAGVSDIRTMCIVLRVFGVSLPAVVFWLLVRRRLARLLGDTRYGDALMLAGALGTHFFIYATQLFSHAIAGILLYAAWRLMQPVGAAVAAMDATATTPSMSAGMSPRSFRFRNFAIGALLAIAFSCDYIVAPAVVVMTIGLIGRSKSVSMRAGTLAGVAIGAAPIAIAWMAYNAACFGHVLDTGFRHHADPIYGAAYQQGLWGVQWPDPMALIGMIALPSRGVGFMSPFLALAAAGWWRARRDAALRPLAVIPACTVVSMMLFTTMMVDWKGGWSVSVRYLVPAIPFLLEGVALSLRQPAAAWTPALFVGGVVMGAFHTAMAAMTFPDCPDLFWNPYYDMALPLLCGGHVNNILLLDGSGWVRVLPFACVVLAALATCVALVAAAERERRAGSASPDQGHVRIRRAIIGALALIAIQTPLAFTLTYARQLELAGVIEKMGYTCDADRARISLHTRQIGGSVGHPYDLIELAWVRAASACPELRHPTEALALVERAGQMIDGTPALAPRLADVRAAALAAQGQFSAAVSNARTALSLLPVGDSRRGAWQKRFEMYQRGEVFARASSDETR